MTRYILCISPSKEYFKSYLLQLRTPVYWIYCFQCQLTLIIKCPQIFFHTATKGSTFSYMFNVFMMDHIHSRMQKRCRYLQGTCSSACHIHCNRVMLWLKWDNSWESALKICSCYKNVRWLYWLLLIIKFP